MRKVVPYLSDDAIERDAAALLTEYAHTRDIVIEAPIPIEDIVEKHLKLRVDFDDLHKVLGVPRTRAEPDIFGAIWFDQREIFIDQSLDPEERPGMEGRYRFTLAHEGGGHWRLHRAYYANDPAQALPFGGAAAPAVVCRSSQAKQRVEWQADFYASCLLMPRKLVMQAWRDHFGSLRPFVFDWERSSWFNPGLQIDGEEVTDTNVHVLADFDFQEVAQPFAREFNVSVQAMRIRLEKLGLLLRSKPQQQSLSGVM